MEFAALIAATREKYELQNAMLRSMSAALRQGLPFSFNNEDMADLLDDIREEHIAHMVD